MSRNIPKVVLWQVSFTRLMESGKTETGKVKILAPTKYLARLNFLAVDSRCAPEGFPVGFSPYCVRVDSIGRIASPEEKSARAAAAAAETAAAAQPPRALHIIAREIRREWRNVYFGAAPYLAALAEMETAAENYGDDSGASIVRYFLANATTFRGARAAALKKELKRHLTGRNR